MSWVATAVVGSAVIGGVASNEAAKKSAKATGKAADASIAEQRRQFDLVRSDTAGQRAVGNAAVDRLMQLYGYGSVPQEAMSYEDWAAKNPLQTIGGGGIFNSVRNAAASAQHEAAYRDYVANFQPETRPAGGPDMGAFFESPDYQFNLDQGQQAIDRSAAARGGLLSGRAVKEGQRYASGLASREYGSFVDRLMQQAGLGSTGIGASAAAGANAANNITATNMAAGAQRGSAYQNMIGGVNNAVQGGISNYLLSRYLQPSAAGTPMAMNYTGSTVGGYV